MMPVGPLMIEHRLIERMISVMQKHIKEVASPTEIDLSIIAQGVDFLRTYADRCHHGKEEDLLFKALVSKPLSDEHKRILRELMEEHTIARAYVKALDAARAQALQGDSSAYREIVEQVEKIAALYPAHIEKEDKYFFVPIMSYFEQIEQDEMLKQFVLFDQGLIHEKYALVVGSLEGNHQPLVQNTVKAGEDRKIYECTVCGYRYDPAVGDPENGIPPRTPFASLPHEWVCPLCGSGPDLFIPVDESSSNDNNFQQAHNEYNSNDFKEYHSKDLDVLWYPKLCSHAGKCWQALPGVFRPEAKPWVDLAAATAEEVIQAIDKCPTGALQYRLPETSSIDSAMAKGPGSADYRIEGPAAVKIRTVKNGPLLVEGPARLFDQDGQLLKEYDRFVLCRCGETKNQPFCDGSHIHNVEKE